MLYKKNESRFSLQFDDENPKHFNAIVVLNEKKRNKANYIADLIWEKEYGAENKEEVQEDTIQNKNELRELIKECLLEVLLENKDMFSIVQSPENKEKAKEKDEEILILEQNSNNAIKYNKEVLSGLSCFGIKK